MSLDVWNCCRTCMNTRALVPISQNAESNMDFIDILNQTTGLNVKLNDNLPQQICRLCVSTVKKFKTFRNSCLTIHTKLERLRLERIGASSEYTHNSDAVDYNSDNDSYSTNNSERKQIDNTTKKHTEGHNEFENTIEELLKSRRPFSFENLKPFSKSLNADQTTHTKCASKKVRTSNDALQAKIAGIIKREQDSEDSLIKQAFEERSKKAPIEVNIKIESAPTEGRSSYECKVCQKLYPSVESCERHAKLHTLVKNVVCEHCGKSFYFKNKLLKHCRSKHGYKKILKCSYCEFLGANTTTVKIHERLHTGERPYGCEVCGARFHRKSTFLQHRAVHLEKTVQCDACPARFKSVTLMRIHKNRAHRPRQYKFNCLLCTATYERRYDCVKHLRRVHRLSDTQSIDCSLDRVKLSDLGD